ncbi:amidase [Desulfomicrobium salsuginis]
MPQTTFIAKTPAFDAYRHASREQLDGLVAALVKRARDLDPQLHILAGDIDGAGIARQTAALFERFPDPQHRPPLFGVPVGVKDIIRVDGAAMRCGALLPPVLFEGPEARCVRMLREAGAIIFVQTATTEFAYFEPAATKNPHNPRHTPGGSSSGSAAGVAAGLFPLALGTQTVGSVIRPASFCGVVGMKPSFDRIPTDGIAYFSRSVDHVGFFCQRAADIPLVLAAFDPQPGGGSRPEALKVGVPAGPYLAQAPAGTLAWFETVLEALRHGGVEVVRVDCLEGIGEIGALHRDLTVAEFAVEQEGLFGEYAHLYRPVTVAAIERGRAVPADRVAAARMSRGNLRRELTSLMDAHSLDLWVCPSALGEAPEGCGSTGDPAMNLPWTHAGLPAISLPAGRGAAGLPMGLQCVGRFGQDQRLAAAAARLETALCGLG